MVLFPSPNGRCLVQFFTPYISVDMKRMAQAFQQDDLNKLEEQVRGIKTHRETDTERTGGGVA